MTFSLPKPREENKPELLDQPNDVMRRYKKITTL
jgi:hypothetical protein